MNRNFYDNVHLFANGKFKMAGSSENKNLLVVDIEGYDSANKTILSNSEIYDPYDFVLVARRIEDMTGEELRNTPILKHTDTSIRNKKTYLVLQANADTLDARDERYLFSVGVYPFNDEDFDNGLVLRYADLYKH